jgi:hypothetical protein
MEVKPTEKPAVLEFEDNWGKDTEKKAPNKPVTVDTPGKKEESAPMASTDTNAVEDPQTTGAPTKEKTRLSASLSAELTSMGIDTLQSIIFKIINNRKITRRIGKENIERFAELLHDLKDSKKILSDLSDDDKRLFWKFRRLKQIEEDIPFEDAEYNKLNDVLEKYYKETGQSMPAWLGLSIALADIIGARLSDAVTE